MNTTETVNLRLGMGRAGDTYYVTVLIVADGKRQRVMADLTAEQYAQMVTGEQVSISAELKTT
jgi:hypothetical protein